MITTRWIKINECLEFRYKGPKWIAFILAKTNASGKEITPILGRIFRIICKVGGAQLQFRRPLPDITGIEVLPGLDQVINTGGQRD